MGQGVVCNHKKVRQSCGVAGCFVLFGRFLGAGLVWGGTVNGSFFGVVAGCFVIPGRVGARGGLNRPGCFNITTQTKKRAQGVGFGAYGC